VSLKEGQFKAEFLKGIDVIDKRKSYVTPLSSYALLPHQ